MPTYDFRCPNGHDFEHFYRKISDAGSELPCPQCGALAQRRVSGGAGLVFKGSGFYLTDYGKNAHRTSGSDGAPSSNDSKSDSGGESKPASKPEPSKSDGSGSAPAKAEAGNSSGGTAAKSETSKSTDTKSSSSKRQSGDSE